MGRIDIIRDELTLDPLVVGYTGMTDQQAADSLNDTGTGRTLPVEMATTSQVYEAVDRGEFESLISETRREAVRDIWSLNEVDLRPGSKARTTLETLFAGVAGPITRPALGALVVRTVSRGEELGVSRIREGDVRNARAI